MLHHAAEYLDHKFMCANLYVLLTYRAFHFAVLRYFAMVVPNFSNTSVLCSALWVLMFGVYDRLL